MICCKDKRWCQFWGECKNGDTCHRALTEAEKESADNCGLGVCVFCEKPECFEEK